MVSLHQILLAVFPTLYHCCNTSKHTHSCGVSTKYCWQCFLPSVTAVIQVNIHIPVVSLHQVLLAVFPTLSHCCTTNKHTYSCGVSLSSIAGSVSYPQSLLYYKQTYIFLWCLSTKYCWHCFLPSVTAVIQVNIHIPVVSLHQVLLAVFPTLCHCCNTSKHTHSCGVSTPSIAGSVSYPQSLL